VGLLLDAVYLRGTGFDSLAETETFGALPRRELVAVAVVAVGLGGAVLARGVVASLAALGALLPVALTGHSVAMAHADLNVVVDGFHLVAASVWLGGLVGMVVVLRGTSSRSDVAFSVVRRFSTIAASVLATLVLAGSVLAWQLVGSWQALVGSAYGRVLLAKIALAAAAIAVAAYNRYRLLPQGARAPTFSVPQSETSIATDRPALRKHIGELRPAARIQVSPPSNGVWLFPPNPNTNG